MPDELKPLARVETPTPGPEMTPAPEQPEEIPETIPETPAMPVKETAAEAAPLPTPVQIAPPRRPIPHPKDEETLKIENILEEDLADLYKQMSPEKQKAFAERGETVTRRIKEMLMKGVRHAKKILEMIIEWLKMIPGVNKFFLEQEAKIKADKIMKL
ncbi:MAG: hypothetical protein HW383_385 [Candidatus Magasanikbacteria bacterium]|nr:hypothetical protein [Candidatus Magasanikbacteria bacterium]